MFVPYLHIFIVVFNNADNRSQITTIDALFLWIISRVLSKADQS